MLPPPRLPPPERIKLCKQQARLVSQHWADSRKRSGSRSTRPRTPLDDRNILQQSHTEDEPVGKRGTGYHQRPPFASRITTPAYVTIIISIWDHQTQCHRCCMISTRRAPRKRSDQYLHWEKMNSNHIGVTVWNRSFQTNPISRLPHDRGSGGSDPAGWQSKKSFSWFNEGEAFTKRRNSTRTWEVSLGRGGGGEVCQAPLHAC